MKKKVSKKKITSVVQKKSEPKFPNLTIFEPKVQNRWVCYIEDNVGKELFPHYLVKMFQRPTITKFISDADIKKIACSPFLQRPLAKRCMEENMFSEDIVLETYDPINPSASKILTSLLNSKKYFTVRLVFLDPVANKVEQWIYSGCEIKKLSFGNLFWGSNSDPATVTATISVASSKLE